MMWMKSYIAKNETKKVSINENFKNFVVLTPSSPYPLLLPVRTLCHLEFITLSALISPAQIQRTL